jgi:hypothetical protein
MKIKLLFILVLGICGLQSCAVMFSGTKDTILINTVPPNADVYIDGNVMGKSGQAIILKRKFANTRQVLLKLNGHEDINFGIDQKVAGAYYLNIPLCLAGLIPGVVGFTVDIATGAALKPRETEFSKTFIPIKK